MRKINQKQLNQVMEQSQARLVYLFGSQARGDAHRESDVDIAVLFDKKLNSKNYLQKEGELICFFSEFFPNKEINLVNLNISSPLLNQNVILEGRLLYSKRELDRILFQIQTLRQYEEYCYLDNIYQQFLYKEIKNL